MSVLRCSESPQISPKLIPRDGNGKPSIYSECKDMAQEFKVIVVYMGLNPNPVNPLFFIAKYLAANIDTAACQCTSQQLRCLGLVFRMAFVLIVKIFAFSVKYVYTSNHKNQSCFQLCASLLA